MANYLGSLTVLGVLVACLPYLVLGYPKHDSKFEKIMGGKEDYLPYQASLDDFCGGSIIHERVILTAAHCVEYHTENTFQVHLGVYDRRYSPLSTAYNVKKIIRHDYRKYESHRNDIALLILDRNIQFSEYVTLIKMADENTEDLVGKTAITSGWGLTETGNYSDLLKSDEEKIISNDECYSIYKRYGSEIFNSQLCTFDKNQSSCIGDSGGPVVVDNTLVGIVSYGSDRGCLQMPSVHTRVSYYHEWISEQIAKIADFDYTDYYY